MARDRVHKTSDDLSDDALLHASPVVYGYSLSDKLWREFVSSIDTRAVSGT